MRDRSTKQIAAEFGVTVPTIANWIKAGCPHSKPGKSYKLDASEVRKWLEAKGKTGLSGPPAVPMENEFAQGKNKLATAKTVLAAETAKLKQLERQEKEGKLHDVAECTQRQVSKVYAVKGALQSLARNMRDVLAHKSPEDIEIELGKAINGILNAFADDVSDATLTCPHCKKEFGCGLE